MGHYNTLKRTDALNLFLTSEPRILSPHSETVQYRNEVCVSMPLEVCSMLDEQDIVLQAKSKAMCAGEMVG